MTKLPRYAILLLFSWRVRIDLDIRAKPIALKPIFSVREIMRLFNGITVKRSVAYATVAFIMGISLIKGAFLSETDILWQIRSGQNILSTGQIISPETWNWLVAGKEWMPNSWLWNVILAFFYDSGGIVAVGFFTALFTAGTLLLTWRLLVLSRVCNVFVQFGIMVAVTLVLFPWVSGRPQQADYLILILFYVIILFVKNVSKNKRMLVLVSASLVLSILWMNLHLTAPFGVALFAAGYWVLSSLHYTETLIRKLVSSLSIGFAGAGGLMVTPFGIDGLLKTFLVTDESKGLITEWMTPSVSTASGLITYISILIFGLGMILLSFKAKKWLFALALIGLVVLSYEAIRFGPFLMLFALTGVYLVPQVNIIQEKLFAWLIAIMAVFTLSIGEYMAVYQFSHPDSMTFIQPSSLKLIHDGARVLTLPNGGSAAILFRPDIFTSTDGRNDVVGKDQIVRVISLYIHDDYVEVSEWLEAESIDAVFIEGDRAYKLTSSMEKIGWASTKVPDGVLYLRP